MRISDWSSDVCSSDLLGLHQPHRGADRAIRVVQRLLHLHRHPRTGRKRQIAFPDVGNDGFECFALVHAPDHTPAAHRVMRSEEHTSELQSLMRISYAVFCLKKKKTKP